MTSNTSLAVRSAPPEVPDSFKKAVGMVQVAMGGLGFLHRKIHNVLLANAQAGLPKGQEVYEIPGAVIAELAGFESHDHATLYECGRDIVRATVEYIDFDAKPNKRRRRRDPGVTTLLADFQVLDNGLVRYQFSRKMVEFLKEPDQFVWVALSAQRKFSSKYELGLYENCLRYIGAGSTGFKDVETWRALLGANEPTYDQFKRLNTMVLKPAISGVNDKSGIEIQPEFEREKRRVARVKFSVREKEQLDLFVYKEHEAIRASAAFQGGCQLGLHELQVIDWIERKGEDYVADAVEYVKAKGDGVKNAKNYFVSALEKGFGQRSPYDRERLSKAKELKVQREQIARERVQNEALAAQIEQAYYAATKAEGLRLFAAQDATVQARFLKELDQTAAMLSAGFVRERWREIDRDFASLEETNKTDSLILGEIARKALEKWGDTAFWSLLQFCLREQVSDDILSILKQSSNFK